LEGMADVSLAERRRDHAGAALQGHPHDPAERSDQQNPEVDENQQQHDCSRPPGADLLPGRSLRAHRLPPNRLTNRSVIRTRKNDRPNSRAETAAASPGLNWLVSWKMNTGAVKVRPGRVPGMPP